MKDVIIFGSLLLLLCLSLFNLAVILALIKENKSLSHPFEGPAPGDQIPEFVLESTHQGLKTKTDYIGQELLMLFLSSTCEPCITLASAMASKLDSGIPSSSANRLVIVWQGDHESATTGTTGALNHHFDILLDKEGADSLHANLGFVGIPAYCQIDSSGRVSSSGIPMIDSSPLSKQFK